MLKVYYCFIHQLPPAQLVQHKLRTLPTPLQQKIEAYKNPWDRILQLSSKLLLQELIRHFKLDAELGLDDMLVSKNNKPYFNNAFYFSNAHSGQIAVCVASTNGDVGIDIEEIKTIDLPIYEDYFTAEEWREINTSENAARKFFTAWTRKEAVLKASGSGVTEDFACFNVMEDIIAFKRNDYYLQEIPVQQGYVCHVACAMPDLKAEVTNIKLF